jgi:hypothetical protein
LAPQSLPVQPTAAWRSGLAATATMPASANAAWSGTRLHRAPASGDGTGLGLAEAVAAGLEANVSVGAGAGVTDPTGGPTPAAGVARRMPGRRAPDTMAVAGNTGPGSD